MISFVPAVPWHLDNPPWEQSVWSKTALYLPIQTLSCNDFHFTRTNNEINVTRKHIWCRLTFFRKLVKLSVHRHLKKKSLPVLGALICNITAGIFSFSLSVCCMLVADAAKKQTIMSEERRTVCLQALWCVHAHMAGESTATNSLIKPYRLWKIPIHKSNGGA